MMDIEKINKTPLGSKKFLFAGIMCSCWVVLIGVAVLYKVDAAALESMIWACGMTSSLYLGGQSVVDSLVRAFALKYGGRNGPNQQ